MNGLIKSLWRFKFSVWKRAHQFDNMINETIR